MRTPRGTKTRAQRLPKGRALCTETTESSSLFKSSLSTNSWSTVRAVSCSPRAQHLPRLATRAVKSTRRRCSHIFQNSHDVFAQLAPRLSLPRCLHHGVFPLFNLNLHRNLQLFSIWNLHHFIIRIVQLRWAATTVFRRRPGASPSATPSHPLLAVLSSFTRCRITETCNLCFTALGTFVRFSTNSNCRSVTRSASFLLSTGVAASLRGSSSNLAFPPSVRPHLTCSSSSVKEPLLNSKIGVWTEDLFFISCSLLFILSPKFLICFFLSISLHLSSFQCLVICLCFCCCSFLSSSSHFLTREN